MHGDNFQKVRIFVAAPNDVINERNKVATVLGDLKALADHIGVILELVEWHQAIPDMGRPEQIILKQLKPKTWDIFIGILWHRFGTPPGTKQLESNEEYLSGTEEEFGVAYHLWKKHKHPRVMFYRCLRPIPPESLDPEQYKLVKDFFDRFSADADHPGLHYTYHDLNQFERVLRQNLIDFLINYSIQEKNYAISQQEVNTVAPQIPNNLPRRTMFFGRSNEMEQVMNALSPDERGWGAVIDGIGGIGKTALAIESAYRAKEQNIFDAFIFISAKQTRLDSRGIKNEAHTAAITLDDFVNETARILGKLSITQLTGDDKQRSLLNELRTIPTLLLYDNLETLSNEEQEALADWLRFLPQGCKAILTSRRRGGEGAFWLRLERLDWIASRSIIEHEAKKDARLKATLQHAGESKWNDLYIETGGSPLALKWTLGLIRTRGFSLERALDVLKQGSSSPGSDLQKFIFEEARNDLADTDMSVLNALSFFVPFATFSALMAVTDLSRTALESVLERLSALSLVNIDQNNDRYSIHPLTRRFIRTDLAKHYHTEITIGMNFSIYWVGFTKQYGGWGNDSYKSFENLENEWKNLYEAASWLWKRIADLDDCTDKSEAANMLIDLASYLSFFVSYSGRWDEYIQLNENAYEAALILGDWRKIGWRAFDVAWMNYKRGQTSTAMIWVDKCSVAWDRGGTKGDKATALKLRGLLAQQIGDYDTAEKFLQETLTIRRSLGAHRETAFALSLLGTLFREKKMYSDARTCFDEALDLSRSVNDKALQASLISSLGMLALDEELWDQAQKWFEEVLLLAPEIGRIELIGRAKRGLAYMHEAKGEIDLALALALDALKIYEALQHRGLAETKELVKKLQNRMHA